MLKWLEQPEAVRTLLKHDPTSHGDCHQCAECEQHRWEPHLADCAVFAAWVKIGHPFAAKAIDIAWDEAIEQEARRGVGPATVVDIDGRTWHAYDSRNGRLPLTQLVHIAREDLELPEGVAAVPEWTR